MGNPVPPSPQPDPGRLAPTAPGEPLCAYSGSLRHKEDK